MTGETPVRRRLVGGALRRYRENLGYALEDAAKVLECDRSKISRIETGQRGVRPKELGELLTEYGVPEPEREILLAIARASRTAGWWEPYTDMLTDAAREYFQVETVAAKLQMYDPQQVPDLLQTVEYASAIADLRHTGGPGGNEVQLTLARQHAILRGQKADLRGQKADLTVIIDEAVLHRIVGSPDVMRRQLRHLAVATGTSGITIQVLPFCRGVRAPGVAGPVTIVRFGGTTELGVVYLNRSGHGDAFLMGSAELTYYSTAFAELADAVLSPADTVRKLRELADAS